MKNREEGGVGGTCVTYGRYEVGGGGGHSGSGGGRGIPECFGKEGPHHSIAGEKQPTTQQPQRDMELKNNKEQQQQELRGSFRSCGRCLLV